MRFLHPEMARWLLTVPLAVGCLFLHFHAKRVFRHRAAIDAHLRSLSRVSPRVRDITACLAAVVALSTLVLAMMRPQLLVTMHLPEYERQDLILVLDRSASMWAADVPPSRFGRAVAEIKAFLTHKPDAIDRVGLVGFAGTSLILSHLTRDPNNLFFYLDWVQEDPEPQYGTDIGAALASARELAQKDGRPTKKIFLVLSDGDDQGRQLATVLTQLRNDETRVYCIGIGGGSDTYIPARGERRANVFLKDERGRLITTRFDETTLRQIATVTGGQYFRSITGTELATALRDVVRSERKRIGWKTTEQFRDLYRESLFTAAAATVLVLLTL
jgi:Ca-activated chloride channel family protein